MRAIINSKESRFFKKLGEFSRDRSGLSTLEYALAASLIAAATIVSVGKIGEETSDAMMGMNASINGNGANNNSGGAGFGDDGAGDNGSAGGDGESGDGASAPDNTNGKKKKKKKKRKKKGKK